MPTIDLSITITAIIGLSAILSPIITTMINNRHQEHMRKLELNHADKIRREEHEREIFEGYIRAAGACVQDSSSPDVLHDFGEHSALAQYYVSCEKAHLINDLALTMRSASIDRTSRVKMLETIIASLRN